MLILLCGAGAVALAGASAGAWHRGRPALAVGLLVGAAFLLRLLMAGLDPFLHDWDERYHALVARNLISDPLRPLLRADPVLPYPYQAWCCNHVWLHKQPLFLWQMALSMKVFGVNELALRLPSALLSSLVLWPVYRLGCLVLRDPLAGYLGAALVALAHYQLEMVSGALGMDHNDVAFLAYVTASIWAFYEYRASPRPLVWLLLTGALAGAAVLCKWLPGLLVYAAWGVLAVFGPRREPGARRWAELGRLLASVGVAAAVALPWQGYSARRFPLESAYERTYNARHFTEALEGHGETWYYHFQLLPTHYGWLLLPLAVGIGLGLRPARRAAVAPLLLVVGLIYVFFSLAATKMYSYTYVVSPLLLLLAAWPLAMGIRALGGVGRLGSDDSNGNQRGWARAGAVGLAVVFVALADLRPWAIRAYHFEDQTDGQLSYPLRRVARVANADLYRHLAQDAPAGTVVFNVNDGDDIEAMFYSGLPAYGGIPAEADVQRLRAQGRRLAVYASRPGTPGVPGYLRTPDVVQLWGEPL